LNSHPVPHCNIFIALGIEEGFKKHSVIFLAATPFPGIFWEYQRLRHG
jgi:hypothetical protein